jgi:hypothetical protein
MTRAEDLLKALNGLRRAADNELSGEAHGAALQHIKDLYRLAGFDGEDTGDGGSEPAPAFAEALSEVRAQAEGELYGNAFYLASKTLDGLASFVRRPISASVEHRPEPEHVQAESPEPVSVTAPESPTVEVVQVAPTGASFDELAAAAKARVEQAAASLGLEIVHQSAPPLDDHHEAHQQDDPLAGFEELEKRSSEPCSMPEIEPIPEPLTTPSATAEAPVVVEVIEAESAREVAEAAHDFGSPAIQAEPMAEYAARHEGYAHESDAVVEVESEPEPAAAAPAHEAPAEVEPEPTYEHVEVTERVEEQHPVPADPEAVAPAPAPERLAEPAPAAPEPVAPPKAAAPSPVREVPPVTAVKKVETGPKVVEKHPEKTFFSLWLDMLFGRRK